MPAADAASAYAALERARRAVARSPLRTEGVDDMFREADHALYEAKRRRRDRTVMAGALASSSRQSAE